MDMHMHTHTHTPMQFYCRSNLFFAFPLSGIIPSQHNHRAASVAVLVKNPPASIGDARDEGSISESERPPGGRKYGIPCQSVSLPGIAHGQRSLAGYSPRGCKDWDITEQPSARTHTHSYPSPGQQLLIPGTPAPGPCRKSASALTSLFF